MCLSIPAKVLEIDGQMAKTDCDGNTVMANISMVPDVQLGEYVIVHAGFAIQKYDEEEAMKTFDMLREVLRADTEEV